MTATTIGRGCVAVCMMCLATHAGAAQDFWTTAGPDGGVIRGLVVDPSDPLAATCGTLGGVFRTLDGGTTWLSANQGLPPFPRALALKLDPTDSHHMLLFVQDQGLFHSLDGGTNWQIVPAAGLGTSTLDGLEISRTNPQRLYAWVSGPPAQMWVSQDGGATFQPGGAGLPLATGCLTCVAASLGNSLQALAGIDDPNPAQTGLYQSSDSGNTWYPRVPNGWDPPGTISVWSIGLFADPVFHYNLALGTREYGPANSDNFGDNLYAQRTGLPAGAPAVTVWSHPAQPTRFYSIVETATGQRALFQANWQDHVVGQVQDWWTWSERTPSLVGTALAASAAGTGDVLWAYGPTGVQYSSDGGSVWAAKNPPLRTADVVALALDQDRGGIVLASVFGKSLSLTRDQGATWDDQPGIPAGGYPMRDLLVQQATCWAATDQGVYCCPSDRVASTWVPVGSGLSRVRRIFPGTEGFAGYAVTDTGFVFENRDWTNQYSTWTDISSGLPHPVSMVALAADPERPGWLIAAAAEQGLWTRPAAADWDRVASWPAERAAYALLTDPSRGWIAVGTDQGIWITTDGGEAWRQAGLPGHRVHFLLPHQTSAVVAGTDAEVYWASEIGGTYRALSEGYPTGGSLTDLACDSARCVLYAAVRSQGVYTYAFSGLPNLDTVSAGNVRVFPNPMTGGRMTVQYATDGPGNVEVSVLNAAGRLVARLQTAAGAAGNHVADLDVESLAPGVYLVVVRSEGRRLGSGKVAVLR